MAILERLFQWACTDSAFADLDDAASEAIVDTLVLAMAIDGELHPVEEAEVAKKASQLPWIWTKGLWDKGPASVREEIGRACLRVNAAATDGDAGVKRHAREVAGRLTTPALREKVFGLCLYVTHADGKTVEPEEELLVALRDTFAITPHRAAEIAKDVRTVMRLS